MPDDGINVRGDVKEIKLSDLTIEPAYQRDVVQARVDAIAAAWDPRRAGAITVSHRDGRYFVVDGDHRVAAARERNVTSLPAIVLKDLTIEEEAALYHALNNDRWPVHQLDLFRARIVAKDPEAVRILKAVNAAGLDIAWTNSAEAVRDRITAVNALEELDAWDILDDTLAIVQEAFPGKTEAYQRTVMLGVGSLLVAFPGRINVKRLISSLQGEGILPLMQAARGMSASLGGALWPHFARAVLHNYTSGLQGQNRIEVNEFKPPRLNRSRRGRGMGLRRSRAGTESRTRTDNRLSEQGRKLFREQRGEVA